MQSAATYRCPACGASLPADRPLWRCDCGSHLDLEPGPGLARGEIAAGEASLWRYRAALRLRQPPRVSLGEGPDLAPFAEPNGKGAGLTLVTFHPLFSGPGVERIEPLAFQRPPAEIELSRADAERLGVANGQTVSVGTNGTTRELRARVNRRLIEGVARIADEHATGLGERVEVMT